MRRLDKQVHVLTGFSSLSAELTFVLHMHMYRTIQHFDVKIKGTEHIIWVIY